jgi:hypothetical protein
MAVISDIENGEVGSSVRGKLNQAIAEINGMPSQLAAKLDVADFTWDNLANKPNSGLWTTAMATQTSKVNSSSFSPVTGLSFDIDDFIPTFYEVLFWLFIQGTSGTSGAKWKFAIPSGLGVVSLQSSQQVAPTNQAINANGAAFPTAANMPSSLAIFGYAKFLSLDDGQFSVNFAQNTSTDDPITVLPESRIEWRKLS